MLINFDGVSQAEYKQLLYELAYQVHTFWMVLHEHCDCLDRCLLQPFKPS